MPVTVPIHTAAQVRAAEAPLLRAGVPLMRRAAHALAGLIAEQHPTRMLVLVGAGDNGGDSPVAQQRERRDRLTFGVPSRP